MLTRAITGSVYVALIISCTYFGGIYLQSVFGILTVLLLHEFANMFQGSNYHPNRFITPVMGGVVFTLATISFHSFNSGNFGFNYLLAFLILLLTAVVSLGIIEIYRAKENPIFNIALSVFSLAYILPAMFLIFALSDQHAFTANVFPLLGIFIMIWCSDTFAYLVGRKFGKNKMAEKISPNKTWEGFFGGFLFAISAGLIIAYFQSNQYLEYAVLGAIVATVGTLGDLFESLIKRNLGLKDSGNILPGHGGLLDRLDSVLFVVPVVYFYCIIVLK